MINPVRYSGNTMHIDLLDRANNIIGVTMVDRRDRALIEDRKWTINKKTGYVYANGKGGGKSNIYLHRLIAGTWKTQYWTDHKNGDKLDNRRSNLRKVTARQSNINKRTKRGELKGIYPVKGGRWQAEVSLTFDTTEEAIKWRQAVVRVIHDPEFIAGCQNMY